MIIHVRGVRLVVTAGAVALALAGCGGTDEVAVTTPPPTTSPEVEGGALAGVQFDVRRDPG